MRLNQDWQPEIEMSFDSLDTFYVRYIIIILIL